jgi:branched-chain amino acid transport system permease protein
MSTAVLRPSGEFKISYASDQTVFPTRMSLVFCIAGIALACLAPLVLGRYGLSLLIQIGYLGIGALGLNLLVGFTGQISIGHGVFFGFGAFASAWLTNRLNVPTLFAIPLAGVATAAVGLAFGLPAARLKGLYLAIASLAAQFILQDFFARASWFTGGVAGTPAPPFSIFGWQADSDGRYFYVVLACTVGAYLLATNFMRTRDGRALVALRDHYLSAEMMGIHLAKYRTLAFGIAAFFGGLGGALYAHYLGFVSVEGFGLLLSVQFLAMIIIGGLGSIMGTLLGTTFMVLLPEVMGGLAAALSGSAIDHLFSLSDGIAFLKEMAIGGAIVLFLIFEPDGLAHRWRLVRAYWKLYPFSH